jgi:folate-binding protein YgfZ
MDPAEYQNAKSGRLALDLHGYSLWEFTGTDRIRYLNGQVTQDVATLPVGTARRAAVTNHKGKMEGEVHVAKLPDRLWVIAPPGQTDTLAPRLAKYIIADDVEMTDVSDQWHGWFQVCPPRIDLPDTAQVFMSRRCGLDGHDIWIPAADPFRAPSASAEVWDALRIKHRCAAWGIDMGHDTLPPEARLEEDAISYTKGCYIGQEVIARLKSVGRVNRLIVLLEADSPTLPTTRPLALFHQGSPAGSITSACLDPERKKVIALATVPRQHAKSGTRLEDVSKGFWTVVEP